MFALAALLLGRPAAAHAEVTAQQVRDAIERGKDYLLRAQRRNGSWREVELYPGGISSLCVVALVNAGVPPEDPAIRRAVEYLRTIPPEKTYTVAVQTMAFAAASPERDFLRIQSNADWLQKAQISRGPTSGMWAYDQRGFGNGDHSNTQYALLALRDAAELGAQVDPDVWRRAEAVWRRTARGDGGWGYRGSGSSGSMTVAGIASLIIVGSQREQGQEKIQPNGNILNCGEFQNDQVLQRAFVWMGRHFSVMVNPNRPGRNDWWLYYMYGLERAGRLSGHRFFGQHDWYREGADVLVNRAQDQLSGAWKGLNAFEAQYPELATAFALLFLSKGKSPVVINKLEFGDDWNNDRHDVPHLTEFLSRRWKRPLHRRLTWQIVNLDAATADDLLQAPIAYFNGHEAPAMDDADLDVLRDYVEAGGTILAEACCSRPEFDRGFRELVRRMYPEGDFQLRRLGPEHPVWRSDFLIDPTSSRPLWGVEFGCRTAIIYSPEDVSCFWEQWSPRSGGQQAETRSMIDKALSIGTNIVAYATGQEFAEKLDRPTQIAASGSIPVPENSRNLLPIAQLRHSGGADAAPKALPNLMVALYGLIPGVQVNPSPPDLAVLDPQLSDFPLLYMHGRSAFGFGGAEVNRLREYLEVGGVLFADATCGSDAFDRSFRELCAELFPEAPLQRIPVDHALFKSAAAEGAWFDVSEVTRREPLRVGPNDPLRNVTRKGEPHLEAIYHDGRFVVIYSPLDISCALEHSQDVKCRGYIHEDALRIAVNVVIYALHYQ